MYFARRGRVLLRHVYKSTVADSTLKRVARYRAPTAPRLIGGQERLNDRMALNESCLQGSEVSRLLSCSTGADQGRGPVDETVLQNCQPLSLPKHILLTMKTYRVDTEDLGECLGEWYG